mmetsp:Transcript_60355/g.161971  ORF Transcript_60355/g.161971 Transcript_60355/m.161971 type:complete len:221 (-) Transcript_60355:81-743(-)
MVKRPFRCQRNYPTSRARAPGPAHCVTVASVRRRTGIPTSCREAWWGTDEAETGRRTTRGASAHDLGARHSLATLVPPPRDDFGAARPPRPARCTRRASAGTPGCHCPKSPRPPRWSHCMSSASAAPTPRPLRRRCPPARVCCGRRCHRKPLVDAAEERYRQPPRLGKPRTPTQYRGDPLYSGRLLGTGREQTGGRQQKPGGAPQPPGPSPAEIPARWSG